MLTTWFLDDGSLVLDASYTLSYGLRYLLCWQGKDIKPLACACFPLKWLFLSLHEYFSMATVQFCYGIIDNVFMGCDL